MPSTFPAMNRGSNLPLGADRAHPEADAPGEIGGDEKSGTFEKTRSLGSLRRTGWTISASTTPSNTHLTVCAIQGKRIRRSARSFSLSRSQRSLASARLLATYGRRTKHASHLHRANAALTPMPDIPNGKLPNGRINCAQRITRPSSARQTSKARRQFRHGLHNR